MRLTKTALTLLGALLTIAGQAAPNLPRGPVMHRPVCPGPAAAGRARCHARVVINASGAPLTTTNASAPAGYSPQDLRSAYAMANIPAFASTPGIAIVDAFDYPAVFADLNTYRAQWGLDPLSPCAGTTTTPASGTGPCFNVLNQLGGSSLPAADTIGWSQEAALDLQMASAMCPACTLVLVEASSDFDDDLATAVNTAAVTLLANVVSASFGGSEAGTSAFNPYYNHPGVAITASAGDTGYGVEFPASSPYVTAVGGTRLTATTGNARGWDETVWNDSYGATGSGCSTEYARQPWQTGVLTLAEQAGCAGRVVADVSAVADPATGVAVYGPTNPNPGGAPNPSGWMVFGGTSVGAPLIAGIYGVGYGAGSAIPNYGSGPYAYAGNAAYLNDVLSGNDVRGRHGCGNATANTYYLCNAVVGYDGPTGLGTPNGFRVFTAAMAATAVADSFEVVQGTISNPLAVAANDTGFIDPVTVSVTAAPLHGTTTPAQGATGVTGAAATVTIAYAPAPGYSGPDSFGYQVTDGGHTGQAVVTINVLADSDGDGVPDVRDNCIDAYNPSQLDADGDGYGNACDADLDNSGLVTVADFAILRGLLGQSAAASPAAAAADLNGSGSVTSADFAILRSQLGNPPGPSGLHPNCPPTCP
jgi:hypothetical protein